MRSVIGTVCFMLLALPITAQAQTGTDQLLQGEVRYESLRGHYLDALLRYNSGLSSSRAQSSPVEASITDARLALGLSDAVEQQLKGAPGGKDAQPSRNRSAYQLAWFYYNSRKPMQALEMLERIEGKTEGVSGTDIDYLRALTYLQVGRFKAAAELFYELPLANRPRGYTQYNMGMAQLLSGNEERGRSTLTSLGEISSRDAELLALKDLANIKLGYRYLQEGSLDQARDSFNRVRLDGPFTNQALLGSGWTLFTMGQIERAIVSWSVLQKKEAINDTVIEAKMALPYAYSKLGVHGKAANLYAHTVEVLESEIAGLDTAIEAVRKGELGRAIVNNRSTQGEDWFTSLAGDSEEPSLYLPLLLANDGFREQAATLHQLALLDSRIEQGVSSAAASIEYAKRVQKDYNTALPTAEKELSAVYRQIKNILPVTPQRKDTANDPVAEIALLKKTYDNYLEARKTTADYIKRVSEYGRELAVLSKQMDRLDKALNSTIANTDKQVEATALAILEQKRNQLKSYHHNALFALAESYDFATGKKQ